MKNKISIILLFVLFALPIPVAVLGSFMALLWSVKAIVKFSSFLEFITALLVVIICTTYIVTYIYSLNKTRKNKKISHETFFPAAHCLIAFLLLLLLNPIGDYINDTKEHFGFAKKDFSVVEELDTHEGFHGDGSYYLILDCSNNKEESLEIIKDWNKLPMSENLNLIMYGGEKDGVTYGYDLAKEVHMPKIENGYYMFEDRSLKSKDSTDDSELFERYSFDFSIAVYDCDTNRMYYFEFDT